MPLYALDQNLWFPPVNEALPDGLLAIGGDLSVNRLLLAYQNGIFPWYEDEVPLWWSPDPRFVLFPSELIISHSMKQLLKREPFDFTINSCFDQVIHHCRKINRADQQGTWITKDIERAYTALHSLGIAHSAEAWKNGELAGGLYGIRMKNVFCGESMFTRQSNASKYAFIKYVQQLQAEGVVMIDCQVYTPHLESLGARMIPRSQFISILQKHAE